MVRVVAQHTPQLFTILGLAELAELPLTMVVEEHTYYRAETHQHYVLYKAALTGFGSGGTFNKAQR